MSTQCRHSLSHVYSSVCIRHSSSQSQKIFLMCELESMRPLMHGLCRCFSRHADSLSLVVESPPLALRAYSPCVLSCLPRWRLAPSPWPNSASARPRRRLPSRRGAPDKRVMNIDLHVLSRSLGRVFAPFHSSLDLSRLIPHQLDVWHARGASGALQSVTHRAPGPPRAGDVSARQSHEKTRYHEARA